MNKKNKKTKQVKSQLVKSKQKLLSQQQQLNQLNSDNLQKPKRKKQNYFDNALVEKLIIQYQKSNYSDTRLYNEIMMHLDKIIIAIIHKYHFYKYFDYEDLVQEGRIACIDGLKRFDMKKVLQPGKSVFSFFSMVVKRNLRFFTLNKNRKLMKEFKYEPVEFNKFDQYNEKYNNPNIVDDIVNFSDFFRRLKIFFDDKKRMKNLVYILEKYTKEISHSIFDHKDFIAFCKSFGYTPEYTAKFLEIIKENKKKLVGF